MHLAVRAIPPILQHDETASDLILLLFAASAGILRLAVLRGGARPGAASHAVGRNARGPRRLLPPQTCQIGAIRRLRRDRRRGIPPAPNGCSGLWPSPERLQEHNCAQAILRLGGSYTPPVRINAFRRHDQRQSGTEHRLRTPEPRRTARHGDRRALRKGNRYAARMLIRASAADLRNAVLMERCRSAGSDGPDSCRFFVCPECGNIYAAEHLDYYCPICLTGRERFVRFE